MMCDPRLKRVETRGWSTNYRDNLVICASKRKPSLAEFGGTPLEYQRAMAVVPFGKAVCVVKLADCKPVEWVVRQPWFTEVEREHGNYAQGEGRFGWITEQCRTLKASVPVVGKQGLFDLSPEEELAVLEALK